MQHQPHPEPRLRLHLLGPAIAQWDGRPVPAWASRRALALLVYLATQRQPIPRSLLVALFWSDKPEAQGRANLSWVLHAVSSVLPGVLTADRHTVQLTADPTYWVDLQAFEIHRHQSVTGLATAATLYRGAFAQGLILADSPEFELWLNAERMAWRQRAVDVLLALATQQMNSGELHPGLATIDRLLDLEPHQEAAHRLRMTLLVRDGRRDAALQQYETCRQLLQHDLGIAPDSETTALYERIHSATPARAFVALTPALPLIGREHELAYALDALVQPECRLLTIVGAGGVGKTRLALAIAEALRARWLHGVVVAALHDIASALELLHHLIEQLGEIPQPGDLKSQLTLHLQDRELLLVLDGCEQFPDVVDLLANLLASAPGITWLVTSHRRLNMRQEWLLDLHGLPFESTDDETQPAASRLFEASAVRVQPQFVAGQAERSQIQRICRMLDGLPLAIELAAMLVRTISCADIADEIALDYGVLQTSLRDVPIRQRSLAAQWEYAWSLLTSEEQQVLGRLGIFQAAFTRQAAGEIALARLPSLSALIDASLLLRHPGGRYGLLEVTRFFARRHLASTPEYAQVCERHASYYAAWAQEWLTQHSVERAASAEFTADLPNIRAGQQWAIANGQTSLVQVYQSILPS